MRLVWKLLRQHVSLLQLGGFFLANLVGMVIILLSIQFYNDILPVFTSHDSFIKKDFLILTKQVSTVGSLFGSNTTFSSAEVEELKEQPFTKHVGAFRPSDYSVAAAIGMQGTGINVATEMFFESVPNEYVDVDSKQWEYTAGDRIIPIILPRNYLNLYNFGFAQSRSLPKISEGLLSMIRLDIRLRGNGRDEAFEGRIVGFSNRLNTILVPETFMNWANTRFAPNRQNAPSRLIVEVYNPTDDRIVKFLKEKGYETEGDQLDAGKTTWFLKLIVGVVLTIGLIICVLSFYILMLSIYLILQKNTTKLENLLLIGYSPFQVAWPYQILTLLLNGVVLLLAFGCIVWIRNIYIGLFAPLFPLLEESHMFPVICTGILLYIGVSFLNVVAIHRKIKAIWLHKS